MRDLLAKAPPPAPPEAIAMASHGRNMTKRGDGMRIGSEGGPHTSFAQAVDFWEFKGSVGKSALGADDAPFFDANSQQDQAFVSIRAAA